MFSLKCQKLAKIDQTFSEPIFTFLNNFFCPINSLKHIYCHESQSKAANPQEPADVWRFWLEKNDWND